MDDRFDVAEIERLLAAATPGPWYTCGLPWFQTGSGVLAGSPDPHAGFLIADTETWGGERDEYLANGGTLKLASPDDDARLIAAAPAAIRSLLSRTRALEAALRDAEKRLRGAGMLGNVGNDPVCDALKDDPS